MDHLNRLFSLFLVFSNQNAILQQHILGKMIYGADIRTHNLLDTSLLRNH